MKKLLLVLLLAVCILAVESGVIKDTKDKIKEKIKDAKERIRDKLNRGEIGSIETLEELSEYEEQYGVVKDTADKIKEKIREIREKIKDKLNRLDIEDDDDSSEELSFYLEQYGAIKDVKDKIKEKIKEVKEKLRDKFNRAEIVSTERPANWSDCLEQDVDAYLDKVLEQARDQIPDPMRLPPRLTFVSLSEGRVWGMQTLHRSSPVEVSCNDDEIFISGKLATDELKARYTWEKEIRGKKKEGFVLVKTSDFEADVEMVVTKGEEHPRLKKFKIQRFKNVKVEITGLGLFTWALAEITTMVSGIFQWAFARAVQGPLLEALERELMEISIS